MSDIVCMICASNERKETVLKETMQSFKESDWPTEPICIFEGPWEMWNELKDLLNKSHRPNAKIVSGAEPKKLVEELIVLTKKDKVAEYKITGKSVSDTN